MSVPHDNNPYDYPASLGICSRCRKDALVVGHIGTCCMTPKEKKNLGVDQENENEV